jgi:hypothetical protein
MWTTAQLERLALEHRILQRDGLTQFGVYYTSSTDRYDVTGTTYTNAGNAYRLWSPIPQGFPNLRPPLYVLEPKVLRTATGGSVNAMGMSHQMHTLTPRHDGLVQICHWRDARWHAGITLSKVLIKGLLWIEAYEQHLATGRSIDSFVRTMGDA